MAIIDSIEFNESTPNKLKDIRYGENWPVVYIIHSTKEAYVGETVNASVRSGQHFRNKDRRRLKKIHLIGDDKFNKSVILDLEHFLINYMSADGKFVLQNGNMGMRAHNYYQREQYKKEFEEIWKQLREEGLVKNSVLDIRNSEMFKYSPYKILSQDQFNVLSSIVQLLVDDKDTKKGETILVNGGAGTGKTVLAIYLMKAFADMNHEDLEADFEADPGYKHVIENLKKLSKMKIGFVVPMQSLRATIRKTFKNVRNLEKNMVLGPMQASNGYYDLLIVDEAHRLKQRKALAQYGQHDDTNKKLGLDSDGTELDWILKCSKNQVLFYDNMQSIRPSDIDRSRFEQLQMDIGKNVLHLNSQFRCLGGDDYIQYIEEILSDDPPKKAKQFECYDLKMFECIEDMVKAIKLKDKQIGLCRVVAGFSWKWESKKNKELKDIFIEGKSYQWNSTNKDWINSANSINEIGCIHTVQGYDLNYVGVIFGNEIKYDKEKGRIYVDKDNYFDLQGKRALKHENSLKEYIINIYKVLLTRGIKGTYVYVCDKALREYLKKYIV